MKTYEFTIYYAIYLEESNEKWNTGYKCISSQGKDIYVAYFNAVEKFKEWLKNRNPWLNKALMNKMVFTDVRLNI